jgi:glycosyltransferase involved in cell wall biosynthesis
MAGTAVRQTSEPAPRLWFLIPGDLNIPTGGYRYDKRIIQGLRVLGWRVEHRALVGDFPLPNRTAIEAVREVVAAIPDGETVVVDGLAYGALPDVAESEGARLGLIALVHHPLWMETGLDPSLSELLRRSEDRALAQARGMIVTSNATARLLSDLGIAQDRIRVVVPGVDRAPAATGSPGRDTRLLCVATLTPRKGHDLLLRALAGVTELPWHLRCVGSLDRDTPWSGEMRRLARDLGLDGRITFTGALDDRQLEQEYRQADLFVSPTRFEGYGMVAAEALAHGLPIVATRTGAMPELISPQAGTLVYPDDPEVLRAALEGLMTDADSRHRLAVGARTAGLRLPTWSESAGAFAAACRGLIARQARG